MNIRTIQKFIMGFIGVMTSISLHAQSPQDTSAIHAILQEEASAWNKGDAQAYSRHFASDGTFTNIVGMFFTGHQQFLERHDQIFKGPFHKTVLGQKVVSLKFLEPDVAIVETLIWISGFSKVPSLPGIKLDPQGRLYTRLMQVMVKESDNWKIVAYHNVDLKPGIPIPEVK